MQTGRRPLPTRQQVASSEPSDRSQILNIRNSKQKTFEAKHDPHRGLHERQRLHDDLDRRDPVLSHHEHGVLAVGREHVVECLVSGPPDRDGFVDHQRQRRAADFGAHLDVRPAVGPAVERGPGGADQDRVARRGRLDRGHERAAVLDVLALPGQDCARGKEGAARLGY